VYTRLSETYDAAESVPTQIERGTEADLIREAARRLLEEGDTVASILRDWTTRGVKPVAGEVWWPTTLVGTLKSPRLAGLLEWQGKKYPTTQWPTIIDVGTHERLVRLFDAVMTWAFASLNASPGARAFYDQQRAKGLEHNDALRRLANRLVGILHGCLKTRTHYDEATAWGHRENLPQSSVAA
jgi:Recombinase